MMRQLIHDFTRFVQHGEDLTAIEYAVALALLLVVGLIAIALLGKSSNGTV